MIVSFNGAFKHRKGRVAMSKKRILILVETSRAFGRQIIQGISQFALEKGSWIVLLEDRGFFEHIPFYYERHPLFCTIP